MIDPRLLGPVAADAACSGPAAPRLEPGDLVTTSENRWNADGEATIYLAGDPGVALAELGRHEPALMGRARLWQVRLTLDAAVDLREPAVRAALGVPDDPRWFLDPGRCRELAARARGTATCDGLVVPSVAVLDDPRRWNAVVFVAPDRPPGSMVSVEGPVADVAFAPPDTADAVRASAH